MKNTLWAYIGSAALIILIAVLFFGFSKKTKAPEVSDTVATTTQSTTDTKSGTTTTKPKTVATTVKTDSFTNIFPQTGSYECTYEEVTSSSRTTNTIYFADGKMRGEFRTLGGASNILVYDGLYMYMWKEGQSTGTVTIPRSISDFPAIVPKNFQTGTVLGSGLNSASWSCHQWSKDASLLQKPSYVIFK